ncbi:protein adenylyltransferase SelO [Adhaeribacter aquaticus]|uniref:protein adenylyltransferase SelO n=1 Tax=Adhaeribacter aquaticus TaxID=299567 RepID=UPI0004220668|nr:YdiU family protein [Adhaeribacter aquaticus]
MQSLSSKIYKNEFVSTFQGDESGDSTPRQTPGVFYSKVLPTPVKKVSLIGWSEELAQELELEKPSEQKDIDILGGNFVAETMAPYAACYAGHQFGHWAGQLGDGRAITLAELETTAGKTWEMQLKGAGLTPYSRRADGRAVLRSSVREYLMSEAMHYLRVPTTRALSLVTTGDMVVRDMLYNGNPQEEPGAVVMRIAPSFLRFGNFEILAARKELENLRKLSDWTINRYYPHIQGEGEAKIIAWFSEVLDRTATMIVEWLRVGFVHGVMNTDNMSILGLTIDYGPYSFLDNYDPKFTPNTTDLPGRRYAFGKQSSIAYWNLGCLAGALAPLFSGTEKLAEVLDTFESNFYGKYFTMMGNKLGLDEVKEKDITFFTNLEKFLTSFQPDMTIFYQLLIDLPQELKDEETVITHFQESFYQELDGNGKEKLFALMKTYSERLKENTSAPEQSKEQMRQHNPRFILRNYLLHQAIEELEKGENKLFLELQEALKAPYSRNADKFFAKRPGWANKKPGSSMLSCSS